MISGSLNRRTFIFYLAATNFVVFNFGFHVHEKAILMTVIPLALDINSGSGTWTKLRFLLLKTVAVWTLLPLLISPGETLVKHLIFVIDYCLTVKLWLNLSLTKMSHKILLYSVVLVIIAI